VPLKSPFSQASTNASHIVRGCIIRCIHTHPDPHAGQRVLRFGPPPAQARIGAILIHGRGASADDILGIAPALATTDVSYVAPQAAGNTWYPYSFLVPIPQNEPGITSGLAVIERLIAAFGEDGVPPNRIAIMGFSQGACLALEFAARHARRYHAIVGFSGGVIGPPGTPRDYPGSLDGTPVFLGCSDVDPHIPLERVHETGEVFRALHAHVDERIYRGMGHTINDDELRAARTLLALPAGARPTAAPSE
jgi:predicted esterase